MSVLQDLRNLYYALFYTAQTLKAVVLASSSLFFSMINATLPLMKFTFSLIPGLLTAMYFAINLVIRLFHLVFTCILFVSLPIVTTCGYLLQWVLPERVVADFNGIITTVASWCSYVTVYVISILFILTGSLIIATEESTPNRNYFRPRTTVPLVCLVAGLVIHYDKIHTNDWVAPVALFTGALWYFISLVYDDIATRESEQRQREREMNTLHWDADGNVTESSRPASPSSLHLYPGLRERTPLKLKKLDSGDNKCCVIRPASSQDTGMPALPGKEDGLVTEILIDKECPICFDCFEADEVVRALSCKHTFHRRCIGRWLARSSRCPICREPQTRFGQLVHALFE